MNALSNANRQQKLSTLHKPALAVFVLMSALFLAGCTGNPVKQDYASATQFKNYQSYQWLTQANLQNIPPFIAQRMQQSILKNLHSRGALMVRENPQAFISYDYQISRTESLEPTTTIGIGLGSRGFGFRGLFPVEYETRVYEEALWQIDIFDQNKQLIWRGSVQKPKAEFDSPLEAEKYTQEVIDSILKQFPPKQLTP